MPARVLNKIKYWYMREPNRDSGRLQDIIEAADYISTFVEDVDYDSFVADKLRYFAVLKNVEIIGEAAYMISQSLKESHSEIPWNQMIKMRHILVHDYSSVLPEILWETASKDVPVLSKQIKELLTSV